MLAAREVVRESTGFSPNDLVFGHTVHGPLVVLQEGLVESKPPRNLMDYVNRFRHCLYVAVEVVGKHLEGTQANQQKLYDCSILSPLLKKELVRSLGLVGYYRAFC